MDFTASATAKDSSIDHERNQREGSAEHKFNHLSGPPPVEINHVELLTKLRRGNLDSMQGLALSLGLTPECLEGLVGVFGKTEDKGCTFRLVIPETGTPQALHFDGHQTVEIKDGTDGRHIKDAFKKYRLPYRRDIEMDTLCEQFSSMSPAKQRRELRARFGEERQKLMPQALPLWFWRPDIDEAGLREGLEYLAQQRQPFPPLPSDLDAAAAVAAYRAVVDALSSTAESGPQALQGLAASLLGDLKTLCDCGFQAETIAAISDKQAADIRAAAEMASAHESLGEIRKWASDRLLLVDTTTTFPSSWETLGRLLASYPASSDWKGRRTMTPQKADAIDDGLREFLDEADSALASCTRASEEKKPANPLSVGNVAAMDNLDKSAQQALERVRDELASTIESLTGSYKRTANSLNTMNACFHKGIRLLGMRAMNFFYARGSGVFHAYEAAIRQHAEGTLSTDDAQRLSSDLSNQIPQVVVSDFMPRVQAWRDLNESLCKLGSAPKWIGGFEIWGDKMYDTLVSNRLASLAFFWQAEEKALKQDWNFSSKPAERFRETSLQSLQFDLAGVDPTDQRKLADTLDFIRRYASLQLYAMDILSRSNIRNRDGVTRENFEKARRNTEFAVKMLKEAMNAYAYLRECADGPSESDAIMGALARKIFILETATLVARNVEPRLKWSSGADKAQDSVPPTLEGDVEAEAAHYVPEDVEINAALVSEPPPETDAPAQTPVQAQEMESIQALADAKKLCWTESVGLVNKGVKLLDSIDGSPSQERNIYLAAEARKAFSRSLEQQMKLKVDLESHASGLPGLSKAKLVKDINEVQLWLKLADNLLSPQRDRLVFPTASGSVEKLAKSKGAVAIVRPEKFVHRLRGTDATTGLREKLIELKVEISADARHGTGFKKTRVQTMLLHLHIDPRVDIARPHDLTRIRQQHIRAAHLKPLFYRLLTNSTAPMTQTETGARQRAQVPYGDVPKGVALTWLNAASMK